MVRPEDIAFSWRMDLLSGYNHDLPQNTAEIIMKYAFLVRADMFDE